MVRLSDIAAELGVSTATVSNALTGKGRMKEETRRQIYEAALSMGYELPSPPLSRNDQIIAITEAAEVAFTAEILSGLSAAAREAETACAVYDLSIFQAGLGLEAKPAQLRPMIERCLAHHPVPPSCVVYIAQYPRPLPGLLAGLNVPCVEVYCCDTGAQATVLYDDQQGAYLAVSRLIAGGRKSIAMLSGPVDSSSVSERMVGYQRALLDHGLAFHPRLFWLGDWSAESGRALSRSLLSGTNRPDAIFAQNDMMAFGALRAAQDLHLCVPEDVAVIGFDNDDFCRCSFPSLTSVNPPLQEMGRKAFALAQRLAVGQTPEETVYRLPCALVTRDSTGGENGTHNQNETEEKTCEANTMPETGAACTND